MLASTLALILMALAIMPANASPTTFPVELRLPVVTLVSASGEERKLEIFVAGELTLESGRAILRNVRLHSPSQSDVSLAPSVLRALRNLLMEVSSFEVAAAFFRAQMEHFTKKKAGLFSDHPFRFTERQLTLWEVPLQFETAKDSTLIAEIRFLQGPTGTVDKVEAISNKGRPFDLEMLLPQIESLNPWEKLGWLLAGKKARVGSVTMKDGGLSETVDLSEVGFQKQMKDEADRVLLRDQVIFQSKAEAKAAEEKFDEEMSKGCATVAGCGCAIAAAAGGGGLAVVYLVLSWLF